MLFNRAGARCFRLLCLAIALPLSTLSAQSDCNLTLHGEVIDHGSGERVDYVNVQLAMAGRGAITDDKGCFTFKKVCPGTLHVLLSRIGYGQREYHVELQSDTTLTFLLDEESVELDQVIVSSRSIELTPTSAREELSGEALASTQGLGLGQSLEQLSGVTTLKTGATIAKPVIQGLHSNRILILNNGVRQESQQWGAEHAPEIDPFVAEKITVVKGANSVRYGSDALGGVILVEPRDLPRDAGLGGALSLAGFSQGRTGVASGFVEGKLNGRLPLSGRFQGTLKKGGNLRAPDYFLRNTGVEERNFSWALGLHQDDYSVEGFYSAFFSKLGILQDSHIGNLTDLRNAIERGRPLTDGSFTYDLNRPLQRVWHELFKLKSTLATGEKGKLSLQLARQFNRRQEFDAHRNAGSLPEGLEEADIEFEITTYTAELDWEHQPIHHLRGSMGLHFQEQRNTTDRGALIPNYENRSLGLFWIERWRNHPQPLELEAGLRYDLRWMDIQQQGLDTIGKSLQFSSLSGTLGAVYQFPSVARLRLNFSTAWRAPHVSELYSDGVHHGSASYELGRPDLQPERAYNTSLTAEADWGRRLRTSLTAYYNLIDHYIFLEPREDPVLTIRGAFPAFNYEQADARLWGIDWQAEMNIAGGLSATTGLSMVRGWNRDLGDYLIFMPPDQLRSSLQYRFRQGREEGNAPFLRLTMTNHHRQDRIPDQSDFAPPPASFTLFDLEAGATFYIAGQPVEAGVSVLNILNQSYRTYLNRFRYFADEPGRNVTIRLRIPFGTTKTSN